MTSMKSVHIGVGDYLQSMLAAVAVAIAVTGVAAGAPLLAAAINR